MKRVARLLSALIAAAVLTAADLALAQSVDPVFDALKRIRGSAVAQPTLQPWMSPEIAGAWRQGFRGQNTAVSIIDDFTSGSRFGGDLGTGRQALRHGEWVQVQAGMIAPSASLFTQDFTSTRSVGLVQNRLNTLNLSYGMFAADGFATSSIGWSPREASIIDHARLGRAVVVKAAGNDSVAVGAPNGSGQVDYLNRALVGGQSALFVGALDRNGTVSNPARRAGYSNFAGNDPAVQSNYLMVGVRTDVMGLAGTSFAAPIVSGYASVLGSKFTGATPTQIANQLLNTARSDTIFNYTPAEHGRGEASIARALAPVSIR